MMHLDEETVKILNVLLGKMRALDHGLKDLRESSQVGVHLDEIECELVVTYGGEPYISVIEGDFGREIRKDEG